MATTQQEGGQAAFKDIVVDDRELEEACRTIEANREAHKHYVDAARLRAEKIKAMESRIRDTVGEEEFDRNGGRVRVGPFLLSVVPRSGGGFEVPEWHSVGVSKQEAP